MEHWKEDDGTGNRGGAPLEPGDVDQSAAVTPPVRTSKASLSAIPEYHAVRTLRYLYVEYSTGERELYDVVADPNELHNLVSTASPVGLRFVSQRLRRARQPGLCSKDVQGGDVPIG